MVTKGAQPRVISKCFTACGACFRVGCPSISQSDEKNEKGRYKAEIDPLTCTGCAICAQVCPVKIKQPHEVTGEMGTVIQMIPELEAE